MKEKTVIKRCLALLLAFVMVISGLTIPEGDVTVAEAADDTAIATNIVGDEGATADNSEAKIGNAYFKTFASAVTQANQANGEVTIELLKDDIAVSNVELRNAITIEGNGHTIKTIQTTSSSGENGFRFYTADVFKLNNIKYAFESAGVAIRIETAGADVRLTNVDITSNINVWYALVNVNATGTDATSKLTFDQVNIKMNTTGAPYGGDKAAIIRTGNGNNKVSITATNSTIDASTANRRHGIYVLSTTEAEINLTDTTIKTQNALPIWDESAKATIDKTRCSMSIASTTGLKDAVGVWTATHTNAETGAVATPVAQVGNKLYETLAAAVTAAGSGATIDILKDITVNNQDITKALTIDGNNHTITTTGTAYAFKVLTNPVAVELKNMNFAFQSTAVAVRTDIAGADLTLTNVDIKSTAAVQHTIINLLGAGTGATTKLTMNKVRVEMDNSTTSVGSDANTGIIRTGNNPYGSGTGYVSGEKTVEITLNDCILDTSTKRVLDTSEGSTAGSQGITGRSGIVIQQTTTATVTLTRTTIQTRDDALILDNSGSANVIVNDGCKFYCDNKEAQIGFAVYATLKDAVAAVKTSTTDVTIDLLKDFTITNCDIYNDNGNAITIDGNGYTVTTGGSESSDATGWGNAFRIYGSPEGTGTYEFKDMTLVHGKSGNLIQINSKTGYTTKNSTVKLTDVTIENTNNGGKASALINTLPANSGSECITLDLEDVNVTMQFAEGVSGDATAGAIIRTGNNNAKTVNINLTNCNLDTTQAKNMRGIIAYSSSTVNITLDGGSIRTQNVALIDKMSTATANVTVNKDCEFYCAEKEAQIGFTVYATLKDAVAAVKTSTTDVKIDLLKDFTITNCDIYNDNGNAITIDGNGYTVTTGGDETAANGYGNAFRIYGSTAGTGTYEFKDMTLVHGKSGNLIQIHSTTTHTTKNSTVKLTDVTIQNTNNGGKASALINTLPANSGSECITLDLEDVNVTMQFAEGVSGDATAGAIIRTGNNNAKTVNINLTNCNLDTTQAKNMRGIIVYTGTTANITLDGGSIKTQNVAPIEAMSDAKASTVTLVNPCEFNAPIQGYEAKIGNTTYRKFDDARAVANEATEAVTIELIKDITISSQAVINNVHNQNITIDGNGKTVTTSASNAIRILYSGTVELRDMEILHTGTRSVVQVGNADDMSIVVNPTLKISDVKLTVDREDANWKYGLILVSAQSGADKTTTLDFDNMDVTVKTGTLDVANHAIVRTGNDHEKTVDITLTDCEWNLEAAPGVHGILIRNYTTSTITMNNSSITTQNVVPIYDATNSATITQNDSVLAAGTYEASIGNTAYQTLAKAIEAVKTTTTDVTIELLKDCTIKVCDIYNTNGKAITIDGNNYTVTTAGAYTEADGWGNSFRIYGSTDGTGTYEFKDMTIVHGASASLIQINKITKDSVNYTTMYSTVKLTNVTIENTNNGGWRHALINALPDGANMTIDLNNVDVTMKFNSDTLDTKDGAIIRTGNASAKTVNINLTDCNFDTTEAAKIRGIYVMGKSTANITIAGENSIKTKTVAPIEANSAAAASTITMNGVCMMDSETEKYNADNSPIAGYDAQIGNVIYMNYSDALAVANASTKNVTLALLQNITINTCNLGKTDKTSTHKIIIEGNDHTVTTSGSSFNAFCVYTDVGFKNMTIAHTLTGSAIQIYKVGVDVDLSKVTIDATRPTTDYNYAIINFVYENATEADQTMLTTLTLDETIIRMASSGKGDNGQSIIRTGNGNDKKNIKMYIVDSTLDASVKTTYTAEDATQATGAAGRVGIRIMAGVTADIEMIDSTIRTLDVVPIYDATYGENMTTNINKTRCVLDIASEDFDAKVAQVGNTLYDDVDKAVAAVNSAKNNVTLDFLGNYTNTGTGIDNAFVIDNANDKDVTVDGNMYTITAEKGGNTFRFEKSGTRNITVKNMTLVQKNYGAAIQVADSNTATEYTINVTDVTIDATKPDNALGYNYALINVLPYNAVSTLNVTRTTVTMATTVAAADRGGAVIRTGNGSTNSNANANAKTVYINLVDSHFDTTGAKGRTGIVVMETTTSTINLTNSSITTKDTYPIKIYNKAVTEDSVVADAATKLLSQMLIYTSNPILSTDGCKINGFNGATTAHTNITIGSAPAVIQDGYIFGGWYTNSACTRKYAIVEEATDTTTFASAYAKYVPECVLGVKTQISTELLDWDGETATTGSIRFVTTLDSLYYQEAGFDYKVVAEDGTIIMDSTNKSNKVYQQLYAMDSDELLTYLPDDEFCAESEYFKALTIQGIPSAFFGATITVTPLWKTMDGTTVKGDPVVITMNEAIDKAKDNSSAFGDGQVAATTYTNRVVLVSDMHYTTEMSRSEYASEYSWDLKWAGFLGRPNDGASIASGNAFGYTQKGKLDAILGDINALASDGKGISSVLVLGDLTLDDYGFRGLENAGGNYLSEFKTYFMDKVTSIYGSCYALAGNHDSYPNADWKKVIGTDRQHVVEVGDAIFVMLDTFVAGKAQSDDGGSGSAYEGITEEDLTFFKGVLNNEKYADKTIFLCAHRYYKSASPSVYEAEFNELINTDKRIVSMFDGHTHKNGVNKTFANCPIVNIGGYAYNGKDAEGNYDYLYYDEAYAWGYQVLEWNDEEAHIYHVKPARTYTGTNGTFTISEDIIEGEMTIKINK